MTNNHSGATSQLAAITTVADLVEVLGLGNTPTDEQQAVIEAGIEPTRVVAGAGSGKTETLSIRVAYQVATGNIAPERVLGLTFTRKAAGELSERMRKYLLTLRAHHQRETPSALRRAALIDTQWPEVTTYDSFAGQIYREYALLIGENPDDQIVGAAVNWHIAHQVASGASTVPDNASSPGALAEKIVNFDNALTSLGRRDLTMFELERYLGDLADNLQACTDIKAGSKKKSEEVTKAISSLTERRQLLPLVRQFQRTKREMGLMSFGDQTSRAVRIVQNVPDVAAQLRQRYGLVILDEYQDTSVAQVDLLSGLFGAGHGVTAVGDPNQAIYGWRGASSTTLSGFGDAFGTPRSSGNPKFTPLTLSIAWRNDAVILRAANATAADLRSSAGIVVPKLTKLDDDVDTSPTDDEPGDVTCIRADDTAGENAAVVEYLQRTWLPARNAHQGPDDATPSAAILCRRKVQFEPLTQALEEAGIPYALGSAGALVERAEVRDIRAALRAATDPTRGSDLMRLLTGARIGIKDLYALERLSRTLVPGQRGGQPNPQETATDDAEQAPEHPSIIEALDHLVDHPGKGDLTAAGRHRCLLIAQSLRTIRDNRNVPIPDLIRLTARSLDLDIELGVHTDADAGSPLAGISALVELATDFDEIPTGQGLTGFLDWIDLGEDKEGGFDDTPVPTPPGAVVLMTMHGSKGLEFDYVVVPGMNQKDFPNFWANPADEKKLKAAFGSGEPPTDAEIASPPWTDKAWLAGPDAQLPGPLRGDSDNQPILDLSEAVDVKTAEQAVMKFQFAGGLHRLREERRLAYVAITRARHGVLLVSSQRFGARKSDFETSQFLTELTTVPGVEYDDRTSDSSDDEAEPDEAAKPDIPTWPTTSGRAATLSVAIETAKDAQPADLSQPHDAGTFEADAAMLLQEREEQTHTYDLDLARISATTLTRALADAEQTRADLVRPIPRPFFDVAQIGTTVHDRIEHHFRQPAIMSDDDLDAATAVERPDDDPATPAQVAAAIEIFEASRWAAMSPISVEDDLTVNVDGHLIPAKIDAVFRIGDQVHIVDWKTGRPPAREAAGQVTTQLQIYRLAWARSHNIAIDQVDASLVYLSARGDDGGPLEVPAASLSEDQIVSAIRQARDSIRTFQGPA